jgi:Family of unknown function (DUF5832)
MAGANQEREDFLTEDSEIPGQKFCLLSFLSPEKVLKNKDVYFFDRFLGTFEYTFRVTMFEKFLMETAKGINDKINTKADEAEQADLSGVAQTLRESRIRIDSLMDSLQGFIKEQSADLKEPKLKEMYTEFIQANREKLEDDFFAKNEFRTTVRGMKVRGVYSSREEAVARSKKLQRMDPIHNIFVGEVGKWLPWDPEPSQIGEQEYAEDQLNTLMKKYKENEEAREQYERENRERLQKNAKRKEPSVSVLPSDSASAGASANTTEEYGGIFNNSGPADLAIARKMEAAKKD